MATNIFELATTLKNLGAKWLSEKKINFTPCYGQFFNDYCLLVAFISDAEPKPLSP